MYLGLRDVKRLTLSATDVDLGVIIDVLFDDRAWTARYKHADITKGYLCAREQHLMDRLRRT